MDASAYLPDGSLDARRGRAAAHRFRALVLGDWHPLVRDPLDLMRLSFAGAAIAFLLGGSLEYAIRLAFTFLVLVGAQRLQRHSRIADRWRFARALLQVGVEHGTRTRRPVA